MAGGVRPAIEADARAIAEVHVRGWRWAYRGLLPASHLAALSVEAREQMWRRSLAGSSTSPVLLVWEEDDQIRGFVAAGSAREEERVSPDSGQLYALYLDEDLLGRGAGRALHDAALDALRTRGLTGAVLWVLENNARGRAFYARQGWIPDGHEKLCPFGDEQRNELRFAHRL